MANRSKQTPQKAFTPPKGRPTRARDGHHGNRRVFGATAQWITLVLALIVLFVVAFILLDGGDFNPFNDDGTLRGAAGSAIGAFAVGR